MAVVFHHTGSPRKTTTAQKEAITARRSQTLCCVSGGGPLRPWGALPLMSVIAAGRVACRELSSFMGAVDVGFRAITCYTPPGKWTP